MAATLQLDILFDAFLYKGARIRMEAPFFAFLTDVKCFWDSAKEKGLGTFIPIAIGGFFALVVALFFLAWNIDYTFSWGIVIFALFSAVVGIGGILLLPKMVAYAIDNVVLTQEIWILRKLFAKLTKKSRLHIAKKVSKNELFTPKCEKATPISPSYPLLKFTHEFVGEKAFNIQLQKEEQPNVILLFMESMRARDIGVLGGKYNVSPNFDRLSKEGVLFTNFYGNSVKTSRSVTSSLFGVPSDVTSSEVSNSVGRPFISLANILAEEGYHTAYLHNGDLSFENQQQFFSYYGFEELIGKDHILATYPDAPVTSWGTPDEYLMNYASDWLVKRASLDKPLFATMYTITNHHPWIIPEGFTPPPLPDDIDERYRRYLSTFAYSDAALGTFVKNLRESGLSKNTILCVLGDHGQPMGEHHDNFVMQRYLYEENIRVPMLILADGHLEKPCQIDEVASQVDLFSTVMDMAGIRGLNHTIGTSLVRNVPDRQVFFHNPYMYRFYGTRKGDYKLIHLRASQQVELYNVTQDPDERHNIEGEHPDVVRALLNDIDHYNLLFRSIYENKLFSP